MKYNLEDLQKGAAKYKEVYCKEFKVPQEFINEEKILSRQSEIEYLYLVSRGCARNKNLESKLHKRGLTDDQATTFSTIAAQYHVHDYTTLQLFMNVLSGFDVLVTPGQVYATLINLPQSPVKDVYITAWQELYGVLAQGYSLASVCSTAYIEAIKVHADAKIASFSTYEQYFKSALKSWKPEKYESIVQMAKACVPASKKSSPTSDISTERVICNDTTELLHAMDKLEEWGYTSDQYQQLASEFDVNLTLAAKAYLRCLQLRDRALEG